MTTLYVRDPFEDYAPAQPELTLRDMERCEASESSSLRKP